MWIGTTVFNNEFATLPVSDEKIDEAITKEAVDALQRTKRYPEVFALAGITRKTDGFPNVTTDKKADFIVLIEPGSFEDRAFGTNQFMRGIGIYQRSMFNSLKRTVGHTGLRIEVFDTQSGQSLGKWGELSFWPSPITLETGPTVSDGDLSQFKESALSQIHITVPTILEKLGLQ